MSWILITGSSRGVGKGLAVYFAEKGWDVIIHGRDQQSLDNTRDEVVSHGVACECVVGDLNDRAMVNKLTLLAKEKGVSVLVNNAGQMCPGLPLQELSDDKVDEMIGTNLTALIKLTFGIYKEFLARQSGSIININSIVGLEEKKNRSIYSASKFGLTGFTRSLALETKGTKIRILGAYLSKVRTVPDDEFGLNMEDVCEKVFLLYENHQYDELIMDDRPEHFRDMTVERNQLLVFYD